MAGKTKKKSKKSKKNQKRIGGLKVVLISLCCLIVTALFFVCWMVVEAHWVRFIRVDVPLRDLPEAFDGVTVMFVTDIHLDEINTPKRALRFMDELAKAQPDILIMGGDYTAFDYQSLFKQIRELDFSGSRGDSVNREVMRRDLFLQGISDFSATMAKVAVAGNHDIRVPGLRESMERAGVTLLKNEVLRLSRDGQELIIAGLDDWDQGEQNVSKAAQYVEPDDCVILVSHSPDALPTVINTPSKGGAGWADLVLCGHTHGGQLTLFGRYTPRNPSQYGERYRTGWTMENGIKILTSNGLGTTGVPFRFFAPPQVYLLTLRCAPDEPRIGILPTQTGGWESIDSAGESIDSAGNGTIDTSNQ